MDAIALHEAGFGNTIATLGTALTTQHVAALARIAPKTVYLCFDGDSAGMRAALRSAPLFATYDLSVRVVALPREDDPDTFIRKHGEIGFNNALRAAKLLSRYRVEMAINGFDLGQVAERIEAIAAAADVISEVQNDIEKDDYIAWLAERWGQAEGVTAPARMQMIQAAVRREVGAAVKRHRTPSTQYPPAVQREAENKDVDQTLAGSNQLSGVAKAERILLSSLLGNPSWRSGILSELPPDKWTEEPHREIAAALRQVDWNDPVDPAVLIDTLSAEAGGLVGELMMNDQAQTVATEEIIKDCIHRVHTYWAQRIAQEMKELITAKLDRGEPVTKEELDAYNSALIATGRKKEPTVD
jgi:DNA primase